MRYLIENTPEKRFLVYILHAIMFQVQNLRLFLRRMFDFIFLDGKEEHFHWLY